MRRRCRTPGGGWRRRSQFVPSLYRLRPADLWKRRRRNRQLQLGRFIGKAMNREGTHCSTCRIRNICAGGCYHESYARFGDPHHRTYHYCDLLRNWSISAYEFTPIFAVTIRLLRTAHNTQEQQPMSELKPSNQKASLTVAKHGGGPRGTKCSQWSPWRDARPLSTPAGKSMRSAASLRSASP